LTPQIELVVAFWLWIIASVKLRFRCQHKIGPVSEGEMRSQKPHIFEVVRSCEFHAHPAGHSMVIRPPIPHSSGH